MTHQTFKVSIIIDDSIENFYIKHYVDECQPIFNKFKNLVFQRNPSVNSPILRIYWIDAEEDKILISCEDDFRMYIEQGRGRKIFFSVVSAAKQQADEEDEAMEAEESNERHKNDRKSKKSAREEEKQRRVAKRLNEKMKSAEEKLRSEEERRARCPELYERKNAERLEKAKRRCEKIRQIIGAFDPANLNSQNDSATNVHVTTSAVPSAPDAEIDPALAVLNPTAETIRLLSSAIAGCLQPCNLINKILTDIIGMVPPPPGEAAAPTSGSTSTQATDGASSTQASLSNDQQQQTEFSRQNSATNTSDLNSPITGHPSNQEIEALFKEAAKELEKMNEIVNNSKTMESSSGGSLGSSMSAITQVEQLMKNMTESTFSNVTLVNAETSMQASDDVGGKAQLPVVEDDFKIITPTKLTRSRESSIEVHDVNSMMSDDSRDWTMLDAAATNDDEEEAGQATASTPLIVRSAQAEQVIWQSPVVVPTEDTDSLKTVVNENPTASLSKTNTAALNEDIRASIQESIENAARMNEFVKNSVAMAQESLKNVNNPAQAQMLEMFQQMERNHMNMAPSAPANSQHAAAASSAAPSAVVTPMFNTHVAPIPVTCPQMVTITVAPKTTPSPVTRTIPIQVEMVAPMTPVSEQANANVTTPQAPLIPTPVTRTIPIRVESGVLASGQPLPVGTSVPPMVSTSQTFPAFGAPMVSTSQTFPAPGAPMVSTSQTVPTFAPPSLPQILRTLSATTQANLMAQADRSSTGAKPKTPQMEPAVIVYDPNPKINAAVHQMMNMGFTNEGGWLTQLLLNVDGDVPKAINFLTPQPKRSQP